MVESLPFMNWLQRMFIMRNHKDHQNSIISLFQISELRRAAHRCHVWHGQVLCDLGTDCVDCGPWKYQVPKSLAAGVGSGPPIRPVQQLVARGLEVYTRRTTSQPSFIMPYTNWKHDVDVSEQMEHAGAVEQGLTQVAHVRFLNPFLSRPFVHVLVRCS